jgi:hypothetical protein
MLARPAAIALMRVVDGFAPRFVHSCAAPWIIARSGLRRERFASSFDRSHAVLVPRLIPCRSVITG